MRIQAISMLAALALVCACAAKPPVNTVENDVGLAKGAVAPEISALDESGQAWSLEKARAGGPIFLVFYRGKWCPYCMRQLQELEAEAVSAARKAGIPLVALSGDSPEDCRFAKQKYGLSFPVLSVGQELLKAYKILNPVNRPDRPAIAHPAVFLVGADGRLAYAFADKDYKNRPPAQDLVEAMKALR
jgi:peroxiredoxin